MFLTYLIGPSSRLILTLEPSAHSSFFKLIFPFLLHPLVEIFRTEFLILPLSVHAIPTLRIECPTATKALFSLDGRLNGDNVHL